MAEDSEVIPSTQQPPTNEDIIRQNQYTVSVINSYNALKNISAVMNGCKSAFDAIQTGMKAAASDLEQTGKVSDSAAQAFSHLTNAVFGAGVAFDKFGENVKIQGLHTFKGQFTEIASTFQNSGEGIKKLTSILTDFGVSGEIIKEASKKGVQGLVSLAGSFVDSADNGLRLKNAIIQLAGKSGELNNIYAMSGPNLQNINNVLAGQAKLMLDVSRATKTTIKDVQGYYSILGSVPGALRETVIGASSAGDKVNLLVAAMQVSKGVGRETTEVLVDMKTAMVEYGLSGENALKFTARMTELSNNLGIPFEGIQSILRDTALSFRMFGSETEGAVKMINNYLGELKNTGISGKAAIEVMNGLTGGIKAMGIAHKAFLSAQTGGPGGLVGAFQIEKKISEGKIDEVFDQVRTTMSKQFGGNIVTLDDAQNSPQAAAQLQRQILTLKSGPLGQFAKSDQDALRILEAFSKIDKGGSKKELSKSILQDDMKKGITLQEQSVTILDEIRESLEAQEAISSIINLETLQKYMTASTGSRILGSDPMIDYRRSLIESSEKAAKKSGTTTNENKEEFNSSIVKNKLGQLVGETLSNIAGTAKTAGLLTSKFFEKMTSAISSKDKKSLEAAKNEKFEEIKRKRAEIKSGPQSSKEKLEELNAEQKITEAIYNKGIELINGSDKKQGRTGGSAAPVAAAAVRATTIAASAQTSQESKAAGTRDSASNQGTKQDSKEINVNVKGICIVCKKTMDESPDNPYTNTAPASKTGH